ncbi:glycerophosphodiester phosphodiesterase [Paucibacter sp. KCTC 42545]|uniref:glycerophosphodiester phosphodiesterase n=1 Tax=Paucibacter sp. KCTC 42545 TaxID=1768242 RepID=UPI000733BF98|nr:glycerophosphodiester phosphodiesterase [Paucibacter sp. KCTC 42545]ALT76256.1 glycerophosphoryl diester phosphodiesterase [Paucibacter sp. KCTC 42545]
MNAQAWPLPFWIAHRGAGKLAPENTLAAFRLGAQHGYRAFECDVKLSSDGIPFLLHDATLERTSNGQGVAGDLPWATLSRLDAGSWHSRAFAGEPLPSLEALARFIIGNRYAFNIEIKPTPGQALLTGQVVGREVLRLWADSGLAPLFSSFEPEALQGARETAPDIPRGLLLDNLREGWLAEAQALGCAAVISNYRLMDQPTVDAIHAAGMKALVYTVNDAEAAQALIARGVDGIITDAVDCFSPA